MAAVYIKILKIDGSSVTCCVETAVILFIYKYLQGENDEILLNFIIDPELNEEETVVVDITDINFTCKSDNVTNLALKNCHFPIYTLDEYYCICGFCAVIREMVKAFKIYSWLLGFRGSSLSACAEFSIWTKFCEVDLIGTVKNILVDLCATIPEDLIRLEYHLQQPVRTHNIRKIASLHAKKNGTNEENGSTIEHSFVEGIDMNVSDLIIFPLIHVSFILYGIENLQSILPLTCNWYKLMLSQEKIPQCAKMLSIQKPFTAQILSVPHVKKESMYKCDPKRYNPDRKCFTKQEKIDKVLKIVNSMDILRNCDYQDNSTLYETFSWDDVPHYANPKGGDLPDSRLSRKKNQIENIVKAALKIVGKNDTIVDFCCGGGHIGILLAYLLPSSSILLLDNKEYSLKKAYDRMKHLNLKNIYIIQSNIDYFRGSFQLGVSLHACGVAADLVINQCIQNRSKFVVAPCCYGKLQENHVLNYPKSKLMYDSVSLQDYLVLGHSADQTHKDEYSKTEQGEKCMKIIDADRCFHAEENNYRVYLAKMIPVTCSPKNNFIIGIPE